jgi:hypothetical protein
MFNHALTVTFNRLFDDLYGRYKSNPIGTPPFCNSCKFLYKAPIANGTTFVYMCNNYACQVYDVEENDMFDCAASQRQDKEWLFD